jgi:hypothetical protein
MPPEVMEMLIRRAHDERAAAVAAMLKRFRFLAAAAFRSLLSVTERERPPRRNARLVPSG